MGSAASAAEAVPRRAPEGDESAESDAASPLPSAEVFVASPPPMIGRSALASPESSGSGARSGGAGDALVELGSPPPLRPSPAAPSVLRRQTGVPVALERPPESGAGSASPAAAGASSSTSTPLAEFRAGRMLPPTGVRSEHSQSGGGGGGGGGASSSLRSGSASPRDAPSFSVPEPEPLMRLLSSGTAENAAYFCVATALGVDVAAECTDLGTGEALDASRVQVHRVVDRAWIVAYCPQRGGLFSVTVCPLIEGDEERSRAVIFEFTLEQTSGEWTYEPPDEVDLLHDAVSELGVVPLARIGQAFRIQGNYLRVPFLAPPNIEFRSIFERVSGSPAPQSPPLAPVPVAHRLAARDRLEGAGGSSGNGGNGGSLLSEFCVLVQREAAHGGDLGFCKVCVPAPGEYCVTVLARRMIQSLGVPTGITVDVDGPAAGGGGGASGSGGGGHATNIAVSQNNLNLLSRAPMTAAGPSSLSATQGPRRGLAARGGGVPSTGASTLEHEGWLELSSYRIVCHRCELLDEPAHCTPSFGVLGLDFPHFVPYVLRTSEELQNTLHYYIAGPPSTTLVAHLKKGGLVFEDGWVRLSRDRPHSASAAGPAVTWRIDVTVPERGDYSLVLLAKGVGAESRYRLVCMHEVVCTGTLEVDAPAAVGDLFGALQLQLDSHIHAAITADEENRVRVSLLTPPRCTIDFRTQLRDDRGSYAGGWINIRQDHFNDGKLWFDVQLPHGGMFTFTVSARTSADSESDYARILQYRIHGPADMTSVEPAMLPLAFQRMGVAPLTHTRAVVGYGAERRAVVRWRVPNAAARMMGALRAVVQERRPGQKKVETVYHALNVLQYARFAREDDEVVVEVTVPNPATAPAVPNTSVFLLQLFLKTPHTGGGFAFLSQYELRPGRGR